MNYLDIIVSLSVLIILEIILGIDNLIFLSIMTEKLPKEQRQRARRWGLMFAWITRLLLLAFALQLVNLTQPLLRFWGFTFSARDLFLLTGGAFLIAKATQEIHDEVSEDEPAIHAAHSTTAAFIRIVIQVGLMDIIFSLDSILTAIGLSNNYYVMVAAITSAIFVMLYANEPVGEFIKKHPTIKMLALSFLILIGMVLVADSFAFHVPRGYVYFAMGFSLAVESLNIIKQARRKRQKIKGSQH